MDTDNFDPWHRHPVSPAPENPDPGNRQAEDLRPSGQPRRQRWSGRTRRILTTSAVSAVLLGSGAAIGIAVTGGASAAISPATTLGSTSASTSAPTTAATTSTGTRATRCATLVGEAVDSNHPRLAHLLKAFCTRPLVRLALVGGEHGTVTFNSKAGPRTAAFERGSVQTDNNGSDIIVAAADGTTWTWNITNTTVIRQAGSKVTASALGDGEKVFVEGTVANGANDALLIRIAKSA